MSKYIKLEDAENAVAEILAEKDNWWYGGEKQYLGDAELKLSDLPAIEVSEDCISREWVLEEYQKGKEKIGSSEFFAELMWLVKNAPSVVPSRAEGEWVVADDESILFTVYKCSRCGKIHASSPHNYCPNCGAKMKGEKND